MNRIYVDHAATTPIHPQVNEAMRPYLEEYFGNPSSIHSFGRDTRGALNQAREQLAHQLGASRNEFVFTSGGTEADNLAIIGGALARQERGKHVVTSKIEHHAVSHTCEQLEVMGFEVTYLPVDETGQVQAQDLQEALRDDTILVTLMYGNNEVGTLQPIHEIGTLLQDKDILFHTDAVQALGVQPFQLKDWPVDMVSMSGHKINGPKGVGCLYMAEDVQIEPLLHGGAQERNIRAGTENVPGIIGFVEAVDVIYAELDDKNEQYLQFKQIMFDTFEQNGIAYKRNGHPKYTLPHILNVSFPDVKADTMLMNLDLEGVAASSGSACTAGSLQPSHVISAMYDNESRAQTAIRFSFGLGNTEEQIQEVAYKVVQVVQRLENTK